MGNKREQVKQTQTFATLATQIMKRKQLLVMSDIHYETIIEHNEPITKDDHQTYQVVANSCE